jgi:WD40 repeat protein
LEGHTVAVFKLVFSGDGTWLYSASGDQTIRIWDVRERRCLTVLRGSSDEINSLALSPDGATLASACKDGVIALWNARPPAQQQAGLMPLGIWGRVAVAFAPSSRTFTLVRGGTVALLDLATREETEQLPALGTDISHVVYSPDGTLLVSGGASGRIRVWSCVERRLLRELDASDVGICQLVFRADGGRLLSVDRRNQAIWWDTVTWQVVQTFTMGPWESMAISPDGRLLAFGLTGGAVRWLNAETGELLAESSGGHRNPPRGIAFSSDGTRAVSAAIDGTVAIWDPSRFQLITSFKGHMMGAHAATFSPDDRRFATGGGAHDVVKLWDVETYREVLTLSAEGSLFWIAAFSPDGRWLTACSLISGQFHLWHAPSWEEIAAAENRPVGGGRGLIPGSLGSLVE